ncbi:MAG: response regulator transcription factor [Spirochaetes bacterium]|nr:response regulator transcription factor [Spirochaetota bacterium]
MESKKVLIIDDDEKINMLLSQYLTKYNFITTSAVKPSDGFKIIESTPPDIIILDIMLPEMDGFEVCKKIRERHNIPIIMLTARGDVTDRIVGLEIGADDYLPKPFEPRELVARIQTILRRMDGTNNKSVKKFHDIEIDYKAHTLLKNGNEISLTTLEFYSLKLFTENPGMTITREMLYEKLKGYEDESYDRSIDVLISRLRQKLDDDPKNPKYIKTIWGAGYKFIG